MRCPLSHTHHFGCCRFALLPLPLAKGRRVLAPHAGQMPAYSNPVAIYCSSCAHVLYITFDKTFKRLKISHRVVDRIVVVWRNAKPFPLLRFIEIAPQSRIEVRNASSRVAKWVAPEMPPEPVCNPHKIKRRVIADEDWAAPAALYKPLVKIYKHLSRVILFAN